MEKFARDIYNVFIGFNDKDTYKQVISTENIIEMINKVCFQRNVGFSMTTSKGGYIHDNGTYVFEESIQLSLIGITKEMALEIAKTLKKMLNQECVFVNVYNSVDTYIIK